MQREQLSLEELSVAAGMTARNVRAYQTKGLIPAPTRKARRSVYGPEHLQRLQAIERARARGASLTLIATHLATGRPLDDDSVVGWHSIAPQSTEATPRSARPRPRAEIGALLAKLDLQRDAVAQAQVEELIAAGVFERQGRQMFTGRDLAAAMTVLQQQGLPVQVALGVAQRAMLAAAPIAESMQATVRTLDQLAVSVSAHLTELACCVVRQIITDHLEA